jgi:predicted dienelactone hydrolase
VPRLAAANAPAGTAAVTVDDVTIGKLTCDGIQTGHIAYPTRAGVLNNTFPLLSFAHGWTEGGIVLKNNYKSVIEDVAAAGYVVVAEHSGLTRLCYPEEKADQLRAMDFVKQTPKYTAMVDWAAKAGVYGHSMGGAASGLNAADASAVSKYNLGATVMLHPAQGGQLARTAIPAFFATGSVDGIVPPGGVHSMYKLAAGPKVFAEMTGANHFECQSSEDGLPEPAGWTSNVIGWFDCHIKGEQAACDKSYAICTDGAIKTTKCEVVKQT